MDKYFIKVDTCVHWIIYKIKIKCHNNFVFASKNIIIKLINHT